MQGHNVGKDADSQEGVLQKVIEQYCRKQLQNQTRWRRCSCHCLVGNAELHAQHVLEDAAAKEEAALELRNVGVGDGSQAATKALAINRLYELTIDKGRVSLAAKQGPFSGVTTDLDFPRKRTKPN